MLEICMSSLKRGRAIATQAWYAVLRHRRGNPDTRYTVTYPYRCTLSTLPGFGLEQTQRSARGVDLTMPLCHQIIPEPFCAFRLSPIFASKSPVNQLWC